MPLTKTQIELLEAVQSKMKHGDIGSIAEKTEFSNAYVSGVLSPNSDWYNEDIVKAAIDIINNREQNTKNLLQSITSED